MTTRHIEMPELEFVCAQLGRSNNSPSGLVWLTGGTGKRGAGRLAGTLTPQGYYRVKLGPKLFQAHRICYFMDTGRDPGPLMVDHIDRDKQNNRKENLRLVTAAQNNSNMRKWKLDSTSRFLGVHRPTGRSRWVARLSASTLGLDVRLGSFACEEAAARAYDAAVLAYQPPGSSTNVALGLLAPFQVEKESA